MKKILYDIYYKGIKLNTSTPSMTFEKAENYIGICLITYGYQAEMVKVEEEE